LTYQIPEKVQDGEINFVSFKPQSIGDYSPGQTVEFKLRSTNEFVILDRSYMKFTLEETGGIAANATTGTILSSMGAQACISQVQDTVSGLQLPLIKNYNLQQALKLNTDTSERKAITAITEKFGGAQAGANNKFQATKCVIPVPTALQSAGKVIPLSVLNGGHNISILLEQGNRVFTNQAVGNSYKITDIEIVCCMLKPDEKYLQELAGAMSRGGSLKIPLQLTKNISATLAGSATQTVRIQSGYLSSLNSITNVIRKASDIGTGVVGTAKDTFKTNTNELASYYFMINSQRYPKNKSIHCATDPENLYQLLAGFNTSYSHLSPFASDTTFCYYAFESNGQFSSGIPLNDGHINIEATFGTTPTAGDVLDCFLEYDSLLVIDQNTVNLIIEV
jgi:hypothetical protein